MSFSRIGKIVLLCAGLVLLATLLVAMAFSHPATEGEQIASPFVESLTDDDPLRMNLLLMGKDRSSGLFDVMMLLSVNESDGSACVLQIPRDTYAAYTDGSYRKLNGAPRALGMKGFCDFCESGSLV